MNRWEQWQGLGADETEGDASGTVAADEDDVWPSVIEPEAKLRGTVAGMGAASTARTRWPFQMLRGAGMVVTGYVSDVGSSEPVLPPGVMVVEVVESKVKLKTTGVLHSDGVMLPVTLRVPSVYWALS